MRIKKKLLAVVISAVLACTCLQIYGIGTSNVFAEEEIASDFDIDENGVLKKYNGEGGDVVIPEGVKRIGDNAFSRHDSTSIPITNSVTSIVIPESVTNIGMSAFSGCSDLTSITIPGSVTSIGAYAFIGTKWLENKQKENPIVIINNIVVDGSKCEGDVRIPDGVTSINESAFSGCSGLTSIVIPESVTNIGQSAFRGCSSLASIAIPNSVASIEDFAFSGCSGLTSIVIPESVTNIGESTFSDCSSLISITVEQGNKVYDSRNNCNAIIKKLISITGELRGELITGCKNTTIPESVISIESSAFSGCSGLISITIPEGVTKIESSVFSGCSGLTSITIPESVASIEFNAFNGCSGLKSITVEQGNKFYDSRDNCNAIIKTETNELIVGGNNTKIPEGVTSIEYSAFKDCSGLTGITIPEGVTSIGGSSFEGCSSLTSITIPESVVSIGEEAFSDCSGLESITVVQGNKVFDSRNNCNAIVETETNELIVGCKNTTIPESITGIYSSAFRGCSGLASITIPQGMTGIGIWAFDGCSGLESITVAQGNKVFDSRNNCNAIVETETNELLVGCKNTIIPDSVTSIGWYAFEGCSGLSSITIPTSITSIGQGAFLGCSSLSSITIPESVTEIFEKDGDTFEPWIIIKGKKGSYAENYANENGYEFEAIDGDNPILMGDLDGDTKVNLNDAKLLLKAAVGIIILTDEQQKVADINNDQKINLNDAKLLLRIAVGIAN